MYVKCLNGDMIEVENRLNIEETILQLHPEWEKYHLRFILDNEDNDENKEIFLLLEPKLQLTIDMKLYDEYYSEHTVNLYYKIEETIIPFHTFTFYRHYETYNDQHPMYRFGTSPYIFSYWSTVKQMIEGVHYRVCCGGVYPSETKEVWDVIVKNIHLFENLV